MSQAKKKKPDPYKRLKYLGYKMSQLPDRYNLKDLVRYAKFQLSLHSHRLMKDPIWDIYTAEELLVEFFALKFSEDKEFRLRFENDAGDIDGSVDEFSKWADKQIAAESKHRDKIMGETEDRVVFDPSQVMGEEE